MTNTSKSSEVGGSPEAESRRKRGLFSCDWCKTKRVACVRTNGNLSIYDPCKACKALKRECKTTIKRKRRKIKPDTIKVNNEYMVNILATIYPGVDFNDTGALKEFYEQLEKGPETKGSAKEKDDGVAELTPAEVEADEEAADELEEMDVVYSGKSIDGIASTSDFGSSYRSFDRVIYDNDGVSHYMGSFGFTNLLTMLLNNFIRLTKKKDLSSIRFVQSMNERGSIMSSFSEKTDISHLNLDSGFPMVCFFTKEEAAFYVNRYTHYNHHLLGGINRGRFSEIYEKFWKIQAGFMPVSSLTYAQYGCIYAVWINGISIELHPAAKMQETYEIMDKYINIIKVILSDVFLSPSPDGILCLLLLSFFFERNMQVETAYILCQTAVCHAMTCGFHRESIATNETSYLWWSLFDREIKLGLYLGRSSTIPLRQVNLRYEQRFTESLDVNSTYNVLMTELNKLIYVMLCNRTKLPSSGKSLHQDHISTALQTDQLFSAFYERLPAKFKNSYLSGNDAEVLINYYSAKLSSTLQFLLYPVEYLVKYLQPILILVESCMNAAFQYVDLVILLQNFDFAHIEFNEALITSYAMLCFVSGVLFYKIGCGSLPVSQRPAGTQDKITLIEQAAKKLYEYNATRILGCSGTMRIRRHWTKALYEDQQLLLAEENVESKTGSTPYYVTTSNMTEVFNAEGDFLLGETLIAEIFNGMGNNR